jgi:hypothetical protein
MDGAIINSELCLRAALNPSSITVQQLKEICCIALNSVYKEEKMSRIEKARNEEKE